MISKTARWIYFLFFSKVPCQNIRTSTEGFSPKNFGSFKKCEKLGFLAILAIFGGSHIIFWKTALTIFLIFGTRYRPHPKAGHGRRPMPRGKIIGASRAKKRPSEKWKFENPLWHSHFWRFGMFYDNFSQKSDSFGIRWFNQPSIFESNVLMLEVSGCHYDRNVAL